MRKIIVVSVISLISFSGIINVFSQNPFDNVIVSSVKEAYMDGRDYFALGMPDIEMSFVDPDSVTIKETVYLTPLLNKEGDKKPVRENERALLVGYHIDTAYVFYNNGLYYTSLARLTSETADKLSRDIILNKYLSERGRLKEELDRTFQKRENRKKQTIQKFGTEAGNSINARKVYVGMTKAMVSESWGKPKNVRSTSDGEQWIYGSGNSLLFQNGRVSTIRITNQ